MKIMEAYRRRRLAQKVQSLVPPPDGDEMDRQNANKLVAAVSAQYASLSSEDYARATRLDRLEISSQASLASQNALNRYKIDVVMRSRSKANPSFAEFHRSVEELVRSIEQNFL